MDQMQGLFAFVRAVETGSFSGGARVMGTTPSAVSRSVAKLEQRLETRLFHRSTRSLSLTDEGQAYFDRVAPLLRDLEDAGDVLRSDGATARGTLRVSMPSVLGTALMDAIVTDFLARYPELRLQVSISDRHVDVIGEGFDLALRAGTLADSGLIRRSLGSVPLRLVASPDYLESAGRPAVIAELEGHRHIRYLPANRPYPLLFADGKKVACAGNLDVDNGMVMLHAALKGAGIAQLLHPVVAPHLKTGALEEVLPNLPLQQVPLHFLHAFERRAPTRARLFMDAVAEHLDALRD